MARKQTPIDKRINPDHAYVVGRFAIIFFFTALMAVSIAIMLIRTTVIHAEDWNNMGLRTLTDTIVERPFRGDILASDGSILATNLYYYKIMVDFRTEGFKIIEFNKAIPELADSLAANFYPYDREKWEAKLRKAIEPTKKRRTRNFLIARAVPKEMLDKVKNFPFFRDFKRSSQTGLKRELVLKRAYPFGEMAHLSIGRVGQMDIDPRVIGRSGLECALDSLLYGVDGIKVKTLSNRGVKYEVRRPAIDGCDVYTTIDITMQDILENELGQMLLLSKAEWGTAMLMEVATGDIKAISNLELDTNSTRPRYIEGMNRMVLGYEPGSVMKVMTMGVALEKGFAHPIGREYQIGRTFRYQNRPVSDTHSPATLPVSRFIEYSSNIGMIKMAMPHYESNTSRFKDDLADMGFFDRFNTGMAGERRPLFKKNPAKIDLSRMVFGYTTQIPPLYTCSFYNAVANKGHFVRPRLVRGLRTPDGRDSIFPVDYVRRDMMSESNAAILRRMMRGVVWEPGGTAKFLQNDVVEIAGKTGTCKIALEDKRPRYDANGNKLVLTPFKGGYRDGHYRVTFCGFFPYENPKYTCIVVISDPKLPYRGPAVSAGAVLKNVALKLYARSLLNPNPVFDPSQKSGTVPTVYTSFDNSRAKNLHRELHINHIQMLHRPDENTAPMCVPDVKGVSIREAIERLESKGYAVDFDGVGYVYAQQPAAGDTAKAGTKVKLSLKYD